MLESPPVSRANQHFTLIVACAMFLALGLVTAAIGPVLPELAARTSSGLADVGAIFSLLFLGAFASQTIAGPLMDRLGQRPLLLAGLLLLAIGVLGVSLSSFLPLTLACALLAGFGHGSIDVGGNVMIALAYPTRRVSALNLLNVFFGVGAVVGPAISSLSLLVLRSALASLWIGATLLFVLLPFVRFSAMGRPSPDRASHANRRAIYGVPVLWILGCLVLLYVGTENGIGGWTTTFMNRTTSLSLDQAALVSSGFWLMLTFGRILAVPVGSRIAPTAVLGISLAGSLVGGIALLLGTGNAVLSLVAVLMLGFFFGPIFPTVLAITTARFSVGPGQAAGVVVVLGSVGAMILPWLQGIFLETMGPVTLALSIAISTAGMLALFAATRKAIKPAPSAEAADSRRVMSSETSQQNRT